MPIPDALLRPLPTLGVHIGHALHKFREIAIAFGPEYKMPMIGHPAIGANAHGGGAECFVDDALESLKIFIAIKNLHPAHAPIKDVK